MIEGIPDSHKTSSRSELVSGESKTVSSDGEVAEATSTAEKSFLAGRNSSVEAGILRKSGILLVDKPKGWTSFDVVNYVRRMVANAEGKKPKNCKVGHTGTLDPLATGLLVILVGKNYTRQAQDMMKQDKTYEVTMKLGQTSTTGDEEGEKSNVSTAKPTKKDIDIAISKFVGEIMQTPPAFSAMKIDGKRAYELARGGKEVKLEARPVKIYKIELTDYKYPFTKFTCDVGSGTYIRSLVEDIGKELTTGAYTTDLRRTRIGKNLIKDAFIVTDVKLEFIISTES